MLDRVAVQVSEMPGEVRLIANQVFPETLLPKGALTLAGTAIGHPVNTVVAIATSMGDMPLEQTPTVGEIGSAWRQGPDPMQMIGQ